MELVMFLLIAISLWGSLKVIWEGINTLLMLSECKMIGELLPSTESNLLNQVSLILFKLKRLTFALLKGSGLSV